MVGVDRIAEEQEEIDLLGTHHIENGVSGSATPAVLPAAQIATPSKGHGCLTSCIGQRCKFSPCRHPCFSCCAVTTFRADNHVISVSCGWREPLKRDRQTEIRFRAGCEQ